MNADRGHATRPSASVLFADLTGFTAMSERMDPEAATDLINQCFAALESVVVACGGVVDKYIGDCVVAVWDLPDPAAAARQACRAGYAIRAAVDQFNRVVAPPAPLGVHSGIGSGSLISGHVGGALTGAASVIGEPVVVAQTLGELSPSGQIYIDAATQALAAAAIEAGAVDASALGKRPEPVSAFELRGLGAGELDLEEVISAALAQSAAAHAAAARAAGRTTRGSERRHATMIFAELAGFEELAQAMTPERFLQLLNRCFTALEPAVQTHGGVIDKYVGETVMALFGVPNAMEHAPRQALHAVVEMRHRLREFVEEQGLVGRLHLRAGVNTGLVIAGELGGPSTRAFTVIGDAVNVAARLKAAAPADAIYVGRDTHRYTRDELDFADLPPLVLKGKEQPVPAWRLLAEYGHVARPRAAAADRAIGSALIGREREIKAIEGAVQQLARGRGGIVAVLGEAGIGKSRLMSELLALPALRQVQVLEGRALSIGQRLSFHPFVDLLRRWAGIAEDDAPRDALAKLALAVRDVLPDTFDDVFPFIARLMGVRVSDESAERLQAIDGEALEALIFKSIRELIEALAQRQPLVLLFEDLHWADQSSIKLLDALLRVVTSHSVLILAIGRPDFSDTLDRILTAAREEHATQLIELHLQRLTDQQCDALIQNLLKTDELPFATRALILRKAEGNPFFIEEVIRSFIDGGAVEYRHGRFHFTEKIETVEVPGTIQEVVMARVDRLDESTRHVLQVASVIGRTFYQRVLSDVMDGAEEIDGALAQLKEKQLVLERQQHGTASVKRRVLQAELEYIFKHALAQEAIYESLLQRTRKDLHRRVARSIESLFAERLIDFYGMLAYHFSRAEELDKAEEYLFKAGEEAARSAASNEALTFFREASRLYFQMHGEGGDARRKAMLEKNIALALLNTGALTESIDHFDRTLEYLGERVPRHRTAIYTRFVANLIVVLARLYAGGRHSRRQVSTTEREVFEVLFQRARALTTSDPRRLFIDNIGGARRLNRVDPTQIDGSCGLYAGISALFAFTAFSFDVSARFLAVARPLIRPDNVRDEFVYRTFWFIHHYLQGHWGDEYAIDDGLVDEALRAGQLWDVNTYVGLLCDRKLRQGDFVAARALVDRLAEISDAYGYGFAATNHDAMRTLLLLEERQLAAAVEASSAYASARYEEPLKILGLGSKAKSQVLLGDLPGAASTLAAADHVLQRAREVAPWHLSAYAAARLRFEAATLATARDGRDAHAGRRRARRSARAALRVAAKVAIQRPEIYQLCGRLAWLLGNRRQAMRHWQMALQAAEEMGARPELARTYAEIGRSLGESGRALDFDGLSAADCTERACTLFSDLGLDWDREQTPTPAVRAA